MGWGTALLRALARGARASRLGAAARPAAGFQPVIAPAPTGGPAPDGGRTRALTLAAAALAAGSGVALSIQADGPSFIGDESRRRLFFTWEKRLRELSSPEKVFQYFASISHEDSQYMTPVDFMRAVIPVFPVDGVRNGCLPGESTASVAKIPKFMDTSIVHDLFSKMSGRHNGYEVITFAEFTFLRTLCAIPERHLATVFRMFDLDGSGAIDLSEFTRVMRVLRNHAGQTGAGVDGLRPGLKQQEAADGAHLSGLAAHLFGRDGRRQLQLNEFMDLARHLQDALCVMEFEHYDAEARGWMTGRHFALSAMSTVPTTHVAGLLARVDALPEALSGTRVSFEEFRAFDTLRSDLTRLYNSLALLTESKGDGVVTAENFRLAADRVCHAKLSDAQVAILLFVFDASGDGQVSLSELFAALQTREGAASGQPQGLKATLSCLAQCRA